MDYKFYNFKPLLIILMAIFLHACNPNSVAKLAKDNKFIGQKDDTELVVLDRADKLAGTWGARIAYKKWGGQTLWLGTADFELKADQDNLYFSEFTINKIVEPKIVESGFTRKRTAVDSAIIRDTPLKLFIPASFDSNSNEIKKMSIGKENTDMDRVLQFALDLSQDPVFGKIAQKTTKGLIWVTRDAKTIVGTDGNELFFIAQRGVKAGDASLSETTGDWQAVSFKYYDNPTITIIGTSELTVKAPSSDFEASLEGTDSEGKTFSGTIFMPDKTVGGSHLEIQAASTRFDGGILLSPDGKYVYGTFFSSQAGQRLEQFIGVKKNK